MMWFLNILFCLTLVGCPCAWTSDEDGGNRQLVRNLWSSDFNPDPSGIVDQGGRVTLKIFGCPEVVTTPKKALRFLQGLRGGNFNGFHDNQEDESPIDHLRRMCDVEGEYEDQVKRLTLGTHDKLRILCELLGAKGAISQVVLGCWKEGEEQHFFAISKNRSGQSLEEATEHLDQVDLAHYYTFAVATLISGHWDFPFEDFRVDHGKFRFYGGLVEDARIGLSDVNGLLVLIDLLCKVISEKVVISEEVQDSIKKLNVDELLTSYLAHCKKRDRDCEDFLLGLKGSDNFLQRSLIHFGSGEVQELRESLEKVKNLFAGERKKKSLNWLFSSVHKDISSIYRNQMFHNPPKMAYGDLKITVLSIKKPSGFVTVAQAAKDTLPRIWEEVSARVESQIAFLELVAEFFWNVGCGLDFSGFDLEQLWTEINEREIPEVLRELVFTHHFDLARFQAKISLGQGNQLQRELLTELEIDGANVPQQTLNLRADVIDKFPNLKSVWLANLGLENGDGLTHFQDLKQLEMLRLPGNQIQQPSFVPMECSWTILDLPENPFNSKTNFMGLMNARHLKVLNLNFAQSIKGRIKDLTFLRGWNALGALYLKGALSQKFTQTVWIAPESLRYIDVSGNKLKKLLTIKYKNQDLVKVSEGSENIQFEYVGN